MEQKNAVNPGARPSTPAAAPKAAAPAQSSGGSSLFSVIAIVVAFVLAQLIFNFVMGAGSRFKGGVNTNDPLPGDYLATMYKGGVIVPFLITMFLCVIIFAVERALPFRRPKAARASNRSYVAYVRS